MLMSVSKFMSSSTTSGRKLRTVEISTLGVPTVSTASKRGGNRMFSVARTPALSSTTNIFDLSLGIIFIL